MRLLAEWLVHPVEYRLWLGLLAALAVGATVLAVRSLRADRAAGRPASPMTLFLVSAPKSLGTLALLLSAFAFVLEVDADAVNKAWFELKADPDWFARIARLVTAGAAIAAGGFLASWALAWFLPADEEPGGAS